MVMVSVCFYLLFMVSWELNVIHSKFVNQNSFDEGFLCDNPGLAKLSSIVDIFQDSRTRYRYVDQSAKRYVDQDVLY